ncbi:MULTISPECIES: GNAT family N-acetyltransferase [Marinomonas]|uniref:GNAT family N-acetyltransferase n=1 Tax=Marinomonas arctica TaxID=383750 RepID=A0A7H1JB98_9GAMM|nr:MULTISPECIES: GNAT family N-acetyltransferase [Marinomonas]MCS7485469.1 hypothetical protein [Marinomonas sp. BSi20414]QNT07764.1 GNAT family N-acetyltransferase [Marinomonas arctica]GGN25348.1 hypothetical protein GCM10011350_15020 [Marinomonas arctica]
MNTRNQVTSRSRSGSFSGTITGNVSTGLFSSREVGSAQYHHSATNRVTTVSSLTNTSGATGAHVAGVGTGLMTAVEALAARSGATKVQTSNTAPTAQPFYERVGYTPEMNQYENARNALAPSFVGDPVGLHATSKRMTATWEKPI